MTNTTGLPRRCASTSIWIVYAKSSMAVDEAMNESQSGTFPSLLRRGGRAIKKMVPFRKGADGVVAREVCFATRFSACRVSDHPVCGASVASQLFTDAAATPPLQGGECRQ